MACPGLVTKTNKLSLELSDTVCAYGSGSNCTEGTAFIVRAYGWQGGATFGSNTCVGAASIIIDTSVCSNCAHIVDVNMFCPAGSYGAEFYFGITGTNIVPGCPGLKICQSNFYLP